jgi:MFS family permease
MFSPYFRLLGHEYPLVIIILIIFLIGLQSMDQWQSYFGSPKGTRLGSLANGTIFGQILAFPVVPWLCDHTGRRFPIFLGSALLVLGAVLQAAAQNYGMFLASRMIIGFGGLIAVEPSPLLISELAYPTHRPVLTAYYNNLWYLGAIFAAWITYATQARLFFSYYTIC